MNPQPIAGVAFTPRTDGRSPLQARGNAVGRTQHHNAAWRQYLDCGKVAADRGRFRIRVRPQRQYRNGPVRVGQRNGRRYRRARGLGHGFS